MAHSCFKQGCELEVQYMCLCLCSQTYSCEFHLEMHLKLPNRIHSFDSILVEPTEGAKCAIIEFLTKETSKKAKLKKIALTAVNKNYSSHKTAIKEHLRRLDSDLKEIKSLIKKLSKFSEKEESSLLNPLILEEDADAKRDKEILTTDSEPYRSVSLFYELGNLRKKRSEILNKPNNKRETEQDFRKTCLLYEKNSTNSLFSQAYQEYINAYQKITSIYLITEVNKKLNLFIYDTESDKEEVKVLKMSPRGAKIIQLPNSELFLINYGNNCDEAYIVNRIYRTQKLPSEEFKDIYTCAYFNKSVYCFGYLKYYMQASRFDFTEYRWIRLARVENEYCNDFGSVAFNDNILISMSDSCNLLLYSIDIDSFSEITLKFSECKRKILINGEERLYLIECDRGWIYESEIGDEYAWNKIAKSIITFNQDQAYFSYNKGGFYISTLDCSEHLRVYYKFDLCQKSLTEIACYGENLALKRLDSKIEVIESYGQAFKLDPDHSSTYIQKRYSLYHLVQSLETLERLNKNIKNHPGESSNYLEKGDVLCSLDRHLEELDCYDKAIKLDPKYLYNYYYKGNVLCCLGRNNEAIDCYNKAIKVSHKDYYPYIRKADALYGMGRILEEIECYNKVIKLKLSENDTYTRKADALYDLGRNLEAIECYDELIKLKHKEEYHYIRKADVLHSIGRNLEAAKWFNKAIKLNSNNYLFFCYRASMLNDLGEITEAIEDFNKAYELLLHGDFDDYDCIDILLVENCLKLLKMLSKLLESVVELKEKIQELKDSRLKNLEILNKIEEKEAAIKEKNSQFVKRAVKCIDFKRRKIPKQIEQAKEEIIEHQKAIFDELAQLSLFLSAQD